MKTSAAAEAELFAFERQSVNPIRPSVGSLRISRMRMLNCREIQISFQCQCQIHSAREVAARFGESG